MKVLYRGAQVFGNGMLQKQDILVSDGRFVSVDGTAATSGADVIDLSGYTVFPGFVDVHVHFREPGFCYKETVRTGSLAAARGGYTTVCTMPNLNPTPDSPAHLAPQLAAIRQDAVIRVIPYGTLTVGEEGRVLSDMEGLAPEVIGYSDDGRGVMNPDIMRAAMQTAKRLGKPIAAHCEDVTLLRGGYIHDGDYAKAHAHRGISSESEWRQVERDIALVRETGCAYHLCHASTKESIALIRAAKQEGLDITCETAPHYLVLNDGMLRESGAFKMNPPVRSESDRLALIEGILDGTVDMIATDHAPHSEEEKSRGLEKSLFGIVGLETAFPVLYTSLVKSGILPLEKLVSLMSGNPAKRFGLPSGIASGLPADFTVFDLRRKYTVDSSEFLSMGKSTPFDGMSVEGKCLMTVCGGKIAYTAIPETQTVE